MHVRIAWEIYNHQQKQKSESKEKSSSSSSSSSNPSGTKSSTNNTTSNTSTTSVSTAGMNPSSLSTPPAGAKSSSSDVLGRVPPTGASDLPSNKPASADLLRGGAHGALFPPGMPRPPSDPFGLIRPPYPGPSLFGPSHLGKLITFKELMFRICYLVSYLYLFEFMRCLIFFRICALSFSSLRYKYSSFRGLG